MPGNTGRRSDRRSPWVHRRAIQHASGERYRVRAAWTLLAPRVLLNIARDTIRLFVVLFAAAPAAGFLTIASSKYRLTRATGVPSPKRGEPSRSPQSRRLRIPSLSVSIGRGASCASTCSTAARRNRSPRSGQYECLARASVAFLCCLVLCAVGTVRGSTSDRIVAMQAGTLVTILALLAIEEGLQRQSFFDVSLALAVLQIPSSLLVARWYRRWL